MNRSALAIIASVLLFVWWAYPENSESKAPMAPVISESTPASGVPNLIAYPRTSEELAMPKDTDPKGSAVTENLRIIEVVTEQLYESPSEMNAVRKALQEKRKLTPQERFDIISALRIKTDVAAEKGYPHARSIVWDLRDADIPAEELGTDRMEKLVSIALAQSADVASSVERSLGRGCPVDAAYWLSMGMDVLRQSLSDRATPEYQSLKEKVDVANAYPFFDSDDPTTQSLAKITTEDCRRHLKCGMG